MVTNKKNEEKEKFIPNGVYSSVIFRFNHGRRRNVSFYLTSNRDVFLYPLRSLKKVETSKYPEKTVLALPLWRTYLSCALCMRLCLTHIIITYILKSRDDLPVVFYSDTYLNVKSFQFATFRILFLYFFMI